MYISHAELNTLKSVFILVFFPAKGIDLQGIKWMVHFSWLRVIHISADTRRGGVRKYKFWCQRIYGWSIHPLKQVIFAHNKMKTVAICDSHTKKVWKAFLDNLFIWKKKRGQVKMSADCKQVGLTKKSVSWMSAGGSKNPNLASADIWTTPKAIWKMTDENTQVWVIS